VHCTASHTGLWLQCWTTSSIAKPAGKPSPGLTWVSQLIHASQQQRREQLDYVMYYVLYEPYDEGYEEAQASRIKTVSAFGAADLAVAETILG